MSVQVSRPIDKMRTKRTRIPDEVREYLASLERHPRLGSRSDDMQAADQGLGFEPVLFDELPAEIQAVVRGRFQVRDGFIYQGDLILQSRTLADREAWREHRREIKSMFEDEEARTDALEDNLETLRAGIGGDTGRPMIDRARSVLPSVRDSTLGGAQAFERGHVSREVLDSVKDIMAGKQQPKE